MTNQVFLGNQGICGAEMRNSGSFPMHLSSFYELQVSFLLYSHQDSDVDSAHTLTHLSPFSSHPTSRTQRKDNSHLPVAMHMHETRIWAGNSSSSSCISFNPDVICRVNVGADAWSHSSLLTPRQALINPTLDDYRISAPRIRPATHLPSSLPWDEPGVSIL
ncbi:hypothetical protein CVT26_007183 [Gymnopilus dilepis]|uniref:Uncharacterized protein n=1 Tax=Gymnopilus dilepis TaxID=231916 RepID=A0A409W0C5_9AGAR|nr:hypothetical protein CVT26_007183 [Gymnopilus dilepis]